MTVWRLQTETASGNISSYCIEKNVAAVGWCFSSIYSENTPELEESLRKIQSFDDYWQLAVKTFKYRSVCSVWRLAYDIQLGDVIWMRSEGEFYAALVGEDSVWRFNTEAREIDAANQRTNIIWRKVDDGLVPYKIRASFRRGFTLQRIHHEEAKTASINLFPAAVITPNGKDDYPDKIDNTCLSLYENLFSLKSPIDIEEGLKSGELICFHADACKPYETSKLRLMYVGRDLGGWDSLEGDNVRELAENMLKDNCTQKFLTCAVHDPQYRDKDGNLTYSILKSPFWQLCRAIMSQAGEGDSWAEKIVWSNVYKVTYDGVSISLPLMNETFEACIEILKYEIELFKPDHIVFVTGDTHFMPQYFGELFTHVNSSVQETDNNTFTVISKGIYTDTNGRKIKMLAVNRPEYRPSTMEEKAKKILDAFNSIDIN